MRPACLMLIVLLYASTLFAAQDGAYNLFKRIVVDLECVAEKASAAVFDAAKLLETASTNMVMRGGEVYRTSRCVYSMNGLMQADSSVFDFSEERCLRMLTMAKCVAAVCAGGFIRNGRFRFGCNSAKIESCKNERSTRRPKCWGCLALHRFSKPVIIDYSTQ